MLSHFYFIFVTIMSSLEMGISFNCILPPGCRIDRVHLYQSYHAEEKNFRRNARGIRCDMNNKNNFKFGFDVSSSPFLTVNQSSCFIDEAPQKRNEESQMIELKWPTNSRPGILEESFGFYNLLNYSKNFEYVVDLTFVNLNGFDISLIDYTKTINMSSLGNFVCLRCKFNFYINRKLVTSCEDIKNTSVEIISIFQLAAKDDIVLILGECEFKQTLCPLVFKNSYISNLIVTDLIDSFYKTSIIRISNETSFSFESNISNLAIFTQDIRLDLNFLNPLVFQNLKTIFIEGSIESIDGAIFKYLKNLFYVNFETNHFRKLIHRNGIEWIKQINNHIHVNLSDSDDIIKYLNQANMEIKIIKLSCKQNKHEDRMSKVFPDEDFCLYADYPFDQMVLLFQACQYTMIPFLDTDYSCTYLWITQFITGSLFDVFISNRDYYNSFALIRNSTAFQSISKCNFEHRLSLCHDYKRKGILGISDFVVFNKILGIIFKISTYVTSLFGITTNLIVILVICHKCNKEQFKEFKQYSYLWINSAFCLLILIIEILSWISECFYPFDVFCPEIRKLVAIQFLRIILKECLVTAFRFMCSFCYVAFALNRIGLIGREHGKIVKFICDVKVPYFILVTLLISLGLSVVKYFKYEVNYDEIESTFPVSIERDLMDQSYLTFFNRPSIIAYFILNTISNLLNYVVLVIVCFIIDVCMVVQLRRTLNEKIQKQEEMLKNSENKESKRKENEEVIKKVIKMVVLNTTIAIVLKMPSSFVPIVNLYAEFFFRNFNERYKNPAFGEFYVRFTDGEFYSSIQDFSTFLYCLSLSIQLFIYLVFDKKFKSGYDNFKTVVLNRKANDSNSNSKRQKI